jgi:hypothetical protein
MTKNKLENVIAESAGKFALEIVKAIKASSLQELIALQEGTSPKKRGRKPGPKPKTKPSPKRKSGRPKALVVAKTKGKRLSSTDKAALLDAIVTHLKKNPGNGCKAIAKKFKLPSRNMGLYLKELRAKGRVEGTGNKAAMKYSAK